MGNIATVGEERRRCFGLGGKPFALCVVTSPREPDAVGAMDEGVQSLRCGECGGWVPSVRWMRKFSAVGAVRTGGQSVWWVRGLGAVGAVSA